MAEEKNKEPWNHKEFNQRAADTSKTLRTWLVAYGIGLPVLVLTKKEVADVVRASGDAELITFLFLSGVELQVFNLFYIKWLSWLRAELLLDEANSHKKLYQWADKLHKAFWTDVVVDGWTLFAYSWGTYLVISLYLHP